jgi:hypothetical protein
MTVVFQAVLGAQPPVVSGRTNNMAGVTVWFLKPGA